MPNENLIDLYLEITQKYTDAPLLFQRASAYHVLSTVLGKYFQLRDIKCGRPNVWFINSSIPGRMRRSTVQDFDEITMRYALTNQLLKQGTSECEAEEQYFLSIIEDGSPQGICDNIISGLKRGITTYTVNCDEFGGTLRKMCNEKNYSYGVDILLSKLYYGQRVKENLSARKQGQDPYRYIPPNLYVTMFSSMQEPKYYLKKRMSRQGLLRRILFIYIKPEDMSMDNWKSPFQDDYIIYKKKLEEFARDYLIPRMALYDDALKQLRVTYADWYLNADIATEPRQSIEAMAKKYDEAVLQESSDVNIYNQTKWEYLAKLTMLESLADNSILGKGSDTMLIADEQHFNRAKEFVDEIGKHTEEWMAELGVEEKKVFTDSRIDTVYKHIKNAGKTGIKHSDLLKKVQYCMSASELKNFCRQLAEDYEKIDIDSSQSQGHRKAVIYRSIL